jgi:hypothetical protein
MEKAGQAAADASQKYLDAGGSIDGARKIMEEQKAAAIRAAIANGGNATAVRKLAAEMFAMPKNVNPKITISGLGQKAAVDALAGAINGLHSRTIYVNTIVSTTGKIASARAEGGPVEAGVPYTINERGPETVTFPMAGMVHPANLSPARGGDGGDYITIRVIHETPTGEVLQEELLRHKRQRQLASLGF